MKVRVVQIGPGMVQQSQSTCDRCQGRGEQVEEGSRCRDCKGKRTVRNKKIIKVGMALSTFRRKKKTHL